MKLSRWTVGVALAALAFASVASAAPEPYKLDPAHTQVGFQVRHFFSKVPGNFKDFSGTILLDPSNLEGSSADVTIQAASVNTNNDRRDNHLRSADFFEVEKFPTLTFKSTKVTKVSDTKLQVAGDLTIRGVTKPTVLDVEFLGAGPVVVEGNPAGTRAGFLATTTINRKDFGVSWNRTLDQGGTLLGDDVAINIGVEAVKQEPEAAQPAASQAPAAEKKPATDKKADKK
jgi:polyisoprenoid-binding protein YceI